MEKGKVLLKWKLIDLATDKLPYILVMVHNANFNMWYILVIMLLTDKHN
jgi:hypothetical protein